MDTFTERCAKSTPSGVLPVTPRVEKFWYVFTRDQYRDAANVNEARKALWNKDFRALNVILESYNTNVKNSFGQAAIY